MIKIWFNSAIVLIVVFIVCDSFSNKKFEIEELEFLNRYYSLSDSSKFYSRIFIIKGYKYNNSFQDSLIDEHVCNLSTSFLDNNTVMGFYKESKFSNRKLLQNYPKGIDRESSDDLIMIYHFKKNKLDHKQIFYKNPDHSMNTKVISEWDCNINHE